MQGTVWLAGGRMMAPGCSGPGRLWVAILAAALGLGGCSDDSNGGSAGGLNPPTRAPAGTGTLLVKVTDAFGSAVSGAEVSISIPGGSQRKTTDGTGQTEFIDVSAGSDVSVTVEATDSYARAKLAVSAGRSYTLELTTLPVSASAGGIVRAWLPDGATSADGRTLEIALQISDVPGFAFTRDQWGDEEWDPWANDGIRIEACVPDAANDHPAFRPDCVSDPDGFDAGYTKVGWSDGVTIERLGEATREWSLGDPMPTPFQAVLLVDQSDISIRDDPADRRLFAAKYFLKYATSFFAAALGAFAADGPTPGRLGLLPQKPLTLYPVENPTFTSDGGSYLPTVDSLATMEGGAAALYVAIDRAIDLHTSSAFTGKRAIVVLTNGKDETCGSPVDCRRVRDALVEKSRATGVAIVTVGYDGGLGTADHETLGLLAQGAPGGGSFWVDDPRQLAPTMRTVRKYLADLKRTAIVRFQIESPDAGTFVSGRTVLGRVKYSDDCPWDCNYVHIPFAVTIP